MNFKGKCFLFWKDKNDLELSTVHLQHGRSLSKKFLGLSIIIAYTQTHWLCLKPCCDLKLFIQIIIAVPWTIQAACMSLLRDSLLAPMLTLTVLESNVWEGSDSSCSDNVSGCIINCGSNRTISEYMLWHAEKHDHCRAVVRIGIMGAV